MSKTQAQDEAQDARARNRIISHMNADHHDSVVLYLQHYCQQPLWKASAGKITDVSLSHMTLTTPGNGGKTHTVPFDPPLKTLREIRERVVEMDKTCRSALDRSDITVTEFLPPTGLWFVEFLASALTFICYSQRWWFEKGEVVESLLGTGFAKFSWTIQPWIISLMLLIHGTEIVLFVPSILLKHGVNPRTRTFWLWTATSFVEGQFAWMRFKGLVAKQREAKEKQKH